MEIQKQKEYKNIAYYKCNNIHFLYLKLKKLIIRFFGEFQSPIWWFPKIEIYKKEKAVRVGWLWLAVGVGYMFSET